MKEIWVDIKDFEGLYQISNYGRVKSLNYNHTGREKILKATKNIDGYYVVSLHKKGKRKTFVVHRLVANAFIINPNNLPQVNHKDENKLNNNVNNLEWCDAKYNINYGERNLKVSAALKGTNFTEDRKRKISEKMKGKKHSEEWKKQHSEAMKGKNNPMYGKHHSEETKKKISVANKKYADED